MITDSNHRLMARLMVSGTVLCLSCLLAAGCDSPQPRKTTETAQEPAPGDNEPHKSPDTTAAADSGRAPAADRGKFARPAPPPIDLASTTPDPDNIQSAKTRYERLVPRVTLQSWKRFDNLVYEANNLLMRGPRDDTTGLYRRSGRKIASTWRRYAQGVRGLFVLRDSLFSQQDHPHANDPYAPLLPPNWVTAVAHAAATDKAFDLPALPGPGAEAGWQAFESPEQLFGDLPASESMFEAATAQNGQDRAENARATLRILYRDVRAMMSAMPQGPKPVAAVGAERIAASDRAYFGEELRRERIIPIFVENPDTHEINEGKGLVVPGEEVSPDVLEGVLRAIYRRRLQDGDLAIERYDLSKPEQRKRAISVLETIIPASQAKNAAETKVWLWVTGELDPNKKLQGEDARAYVPTFRKELAAARIDTSRLELFSKPSVELSEDNFEAELERQMAAFDKLDMPMSIELPTTAKPLHNIICCE